MNYFRVNAIFILVIPAHRESNYLNTDYQIFDVSSSKRLLERFLHRG